MRYLVSILFFVAFTLVGCEKNNTITTTSRPYQEYHSLTCNVPIAIEINKGASQIQIVAPESLHEKIIFDFVDGDLKISIDDLLFQSWDEKPKVILPTPKTLDKISLYSMIDLVLNAKIKLHDICWDASNLKVNNYICSLFNSGADIMCQKSLVVEEGNFGTIKTM